MAPSYATHDFLLSSSFCLRKVVYSSPPSLAALHPLEFVFDVEHRRISNRLLLTKLRQPESCVGQPLRLDLRHYHRYLSSEKVSLDGDRHEVYVRDEVKTHTEYGFELRLRSLKRQPHHTEPYRLSHRRLADWVIATV